MSYTTVDAQSWYIYDDQWNANRDSLLLQALIKKKEESNLVPPHKSQHVKLCVLADLNSGFNRKISLDDLEERLAFLKGRYKTFKRISNTNGAKWDVEKNMVCASEAVWKKMIKEDEFAEAYFWKGEPEWRNLRLLFDQETVQVDPSSSSTVIVNSDSLSGEFAQSPKANDSPYSEGEVTSASLTAFPKEGSPNVVSRLFGDTKAKDTNNWGAMARRVQFRGRNDAVRNPSDGDGSQDDAESSCASSWAPWN